MAWPGIRDIAYFVTASLEADREARRIERELVRRYVTRLGDHGVDTDGDHMWTLYRAAITEPCLAFVCTAEAGERMQSFEIPGSASNVPSPLSRRTTVSPSCAR